MSALPDVNLLDGSLYKIRDHSRLSVEHQSAYGPARSPIPLQSGPCPRAHRYWRTTAGLADCADCGTTQRNPGAEQEPGSGSARAGCPGPAGVIQTMSRYEKNGGLVMNKALMGG